MRPVLKPTIEWTKRLSRTLFRVQLEIWLGKPSHIQLLLLFMFHARYSEWISKYLLIHPRPGGIYELLVIM